jgi:hypothetical protein
MIPLIEVLFSVYFFLSFLSRAGCWTWLHSRSFVHIVLLRPKLVTVDGVFLMKEVHMGYYLRPYIMTANVVPVRRQSAML